MAITDLTNTTWNIPAGWTASAGYGQFNVTNIMYETGGIGKIFYIGYEFNPVEGSISGKANIAGNNVYGTVSNTNGFSLKITGGADATNTKLISWLQENGTLVTSKAPNYTALDDALDRLAVAIAERTGAELPLTLEEMLEAAKEIGSAALISFTISGTTYQAEEGMTWQQWVNSDYNTNNKYRRGGGMSMYVEETAKRNYYIYDTTTNNCVLLEDIIEANGVYNTKYVDPVGGIKLIWQ